MLSAFLLELILGKPLTKRQRKKLTKKMLFLISYIILSTLGCYYFYKLSAKHYRDRLAITEAYQTLKAVNMSIITYNREIIMINARMARINTMLLEDSLEKEIKDPRLFTPLRKPPTDLKLKDFKRVESIQREHIAKIKEAMSLIEGYYRPHGDFTAHHLNLVSPVFNLENIVKPNQYLDDTTQTNDIGK